MRPAACSGMCESCQWVTPALCCFVMPQFDIIHSFGLISFSYWMLQPVTGRTGQRVTLDRLPVTELIQLETHTWTILFNDSTRITRKIHKGLEMTLLLHQRKMTVVDITVEWWETSYLASCSCRHYQRWSRYEGGLHVVSSLCTSQWSSLSKWAAFYRGSPPRRTGRSTSEGKDHGEDEREDCFLHVCVLVFL